MSLFKSSRMLGWAMASLVLIALALLVQQALPGSVIAVTLYKAHLMALGGWGGYWLDRAIFPYDRPHQYLEDQDEPAAELLLQEAAHGISVTGLAGTAMAHAMLRRAIIVAACLICAGLGA